MALLQSKGSIYAIYGKYPDDTQDSNEENTKGDTVSVIQALLALNMLCEVSATTEEMTKQLKRKAGSHQNRLKA